MNAPQDTAQELAALSVAEAAARLRAIEEDVARRLKTANSALYGAAGGALLGGAHGWMRGGGLRDVAREALMGGAAGGAAGSLVSALAGMGSAPSTAPSDAEIAKDYNDRSNIGKYVAYGSGRAPEGTHLGDALLAAPNVVDLWRKNPLPPSIMTPGHQHAAQNALHYGGAAVSGASVANTGMRTFRDARLNKATNVMRGLKTMLKDKGATSLYNELGKYREDRFRPLGPLSDMGAAIRGTHADIGVHIQNLPQYELRGAAATANWNAATTRLNTATMQRDALKSALGAGRSLDGTRLTTYGKQVYAQRLAAAEAAATSASAAATAAKEELASWTERIQRATLLTRAEAAGSALGKNRAFGFLGQERNPAGGGTKMLRTLAKFLPLLTTLGANTP